MRVIQFEGRLLFRRVQNNPETNESRDKERDQGVPHDGHNIPPEWICERRTSLALTAASEQNLSPCLPFVGDRALTDGGPLGSPGLALGRRDVYNVYPARRGRRRSSTPTERDP